MTFSMYSFLKEWIKKNCSTSFNDSNGKESITNEVHGFDAHGRRVLPRNRKNYEFNRNIDRDIPSNELRKEMLYMFESLRNEMELLRNETDLKLLNIMNQLKMICQNND